MAGRISRGEKKHPPPHWMDLATISHASTSALWNYFKKAHLRVRTTNSFQTSSCFFVWWPPIVPASLSPGAAHWSVSGSLHLFTRLNETTSLSSDLSTYNVYADAHSFGVPTVAAECCCGHLPHPELFRGTAHSPAEEVPCGSSVVGGGAAIIQRLANKTLLWLWPPGKQASRQTNLGGVTRKWNSYF